MKIAEIETFYVKLPLRRPHSWASSNLPIGSYLILKLRTDAGVVGWGEAPTLIDWGGDHQRYYGESAPMAAHVIADYLLPAIRGEDIFAIERIHERMDRAVKGHFYAKAAVDIACYDAMGLAAGRSLRKAVGPAIELTVDVNQAWRTPKQAIRMIREMEPHGVAFVEQPCDGLDALAQVAQAVETPIMADESAWSQI